MWCKATAALWVGSIILILWALATAEEDPEDKMRREARQAIEDFRYNREPPAYPARETVTKAAFAAIVIWLIWWLL